MHNFLVWRGSGTNAIISGFFIIAPILLFEDLQMPELYSLSTIVYKLKQKKWKKTVLTRNEIKILFL